MANLIASARRRIKLASMLIASARRRIKLASMLIASRLVLGAIRSGQQA